MHTLYARLCRLLLLLACGGFGLAALVACARMPGAAFLLLAAWAWWHRRRWRGSGWAHGTARAASLSELARAGLLGQGGLILGRTGLAPPPTRAEGVRALGNPRIDPATACRLFLAAIDVRGGREDLIRVRDYVHLATFAPTGRGKGVSCLVPNLLSHAGSTVVTDPKGELFRLTATHRRRRLKHRIVRLDPFGLGGPGSDALNPLDFIDASAPDFLDQVRDLAHAIVFRKGSEPDPHWNDACELVLVAIVAYTCACEPNPAERNLQTMRDIVSSRHRFALAMEMMQQVDGFGGVIRRLGHQLTWFVERELGSVLTTVQRQTSFLDSPAVAAVTGRSSFDPRDLRSGRMTVYLCLPPERLVTLAPLMRLWISSLLRIVTRGQPDERRTILFLLDEVGHLGRIPAVEDAVTLMRGYGIRLWMFFQSVGQMAQCFGEKASAILDNIDTQQYFGTNAYESAESISKRCGDATILVESLNRNTSYSRPAGSGSRDPQSEQVSTGTSLTVSEHGRPLWRPDEILRLPDDVALVFHKNLPVIPTRLIRYYDAPEFRRGRTGDSRGLGPGAGLTVLLYLFLGILLVVSAASMALPRPEPHPVLAPAWRPGPAIPGHPGPWHDSPGLPALPAGSAQPWSPAPDFPGDPPHPFRPVHPRTLRGNGW